MHSCKNKTVMGSWLRYFSFIYNCATGDQKLFVSLSAKLADEHILDLAERITSNFDLLKLGLKVLKIPNFTIKAARADNSHSIQEAAYNVLMSWRGGIATEQEAFRVLHTGLVEAGFVQLAAELCQWVGTEDGPEPSAIASATSSEETTGTGTHSKVRTWKERHSEMKKCLAKWRVTSC